MSVTHSHKVQTSLTDYIAVEKLGSPASIDNTTNKKRKTISGEFPDSKRQSSNSNRILQNTTPTIISETTAPTSNPPAQQASQEDMPVSSEDKLDSVSEEEKRLLKMENRLETKMKESIKESVKESVKESMQEVIDNTLTTAMSKMTEAVNELIKTNKAVVTQQNAIQALEYENKTLNCRVQKLEYEQNKLKTKLDHIETKNLKCSVIIRGITEMAYEDTSTLMEQVYAELSNTIDARTNHAKLKLAKEINLVRCKRIGRPISGRTRPVSVEFQYQQDMDYILGNKKYLRKGIYLDKEYTPEVERRRRLLRPILKAARNLAEYEGSCRMEDDRLVINGKHHTIENLDQLPEKLNVFNITSCSNETTIGFFGELNPLSNFHKANFVCDNIQYHCSEQYIQHRKADYFGDRISSNKILNSTTALECKQISAGIRNYDKRQWEKIAKNICKPGLKSKFSQNPGLADILLKCTEDKQIVESTTDRVWGTGIPLTSQDCLDHSKWISPGILGEILGEIRSELQQRKHSPIPEDVRMDIAYNANEDPTRPLTVIQSRFGVETQNYLPHARKNKTTNKHPSNGN